MPRLINLLAHKALLAAFGEGKEQVEPRHAAAAITDTELGETRRWPRALAATLATAGIASLLWWGVQP